MFWMSARNSSERMEISDFNRPAALKISMTSAWSSSSGGGLYDAGAHDLEKSNIIPDDQDFFVRHGQSKGLR